MWTNCIDKTHDIILLTTERHDDYDILLCGSRLSVSIIHCIQRLIKLTIYNTTKYVVKDKPSYIILYIIESRRLL